MKVFLLKDVEKIGVSGEIIKVSDGFATNFLVPRKLAVIVTPENELLFTQRRKVIEKREEVIATKTSLLAQKISSLELKLKRKMHDDGKLYGAISQQEIADLLLAHPEKISIKKSQVEIDKSIKAKGSYLITIKLSNNLKPQIKLHILSE